MSGAVASLRIDGDDLGMDLLPEIDRSFGLNLPRDGFAEVVTLGDLHRVVTQNMKVSGGEACATSLAFYSLRRALKNGRSSRLRPDTRLCEAFDGSPAALRRKLAGSTGMAMPNRYIGMVGYLGLIGIAVAAVSAWWLGSIWPLVVGLPLGMFFVRIDPGSWSAEWKTLGTLSRSVAALNHAALTRQGARSGPDDIWRALTILVGSYAPEILPGNMTPEVRLLA